MEATHPPHVTEDEATFDELFLSLIDDCVFEICIDFHWLFRTGQITLEELYDVNPVILDQPEEMAPVQRKRDEKRSALIQLSIICDLCGEPVAGHRYAPHLEKCMNGGKRGGRRHYDTLQDTNKSTSTKSKSKKEPVVDPFPDSPVVRIRLKNGVPSGNTKRMGASLEEFNSNNSLHSQDDL